ncbi:hypothetical protein [Fibrella aquatilis]|uniref:MoxR-vWA-beta-propeller ternary system domain-containing protein n=1 Tax=Fibrella aquatilis TaxID=2817059 RepID=A0A939JY80_9BACT|nr:hypothetical protein [Fibrella aquatilis]MBO0931809.1 hypothetical protein [Fibrella aquatilis]
MQLRIDPSPRNVYPIGGLLIRGAQPGGWVAEVQRMGLSLQQCVVYALPGAVPNSVWGCLVDLPLGITVADPGPNAACQLAEGLLYLPERAALYPALAADELPRLLRQVPHLLHPELGLVELVDVVNWSQLLNLPAERPMTVLRPAQSVAEPARVHSFRVVPVAPETALAGLADGFGSAASDPIDKPLSLPEKVKLGLLRTLFRREETAKSAGSTSRPTGLANWFERLFSPGSEVMNRLQQDFDKLDERNQKQLDKLLKLLRDNPELALKYALPLDSEGTSRGGNTGGALFNWSVRWLDFSLSGSNSSGRGRGGGPTLAEAQFAALQAQYSQTAEAFIRQQDYRKAAFVYLKLLKEPLHAAQTLEAGKLYAEAAAIYLKSLKNKAKAAECYENGQMTHEAIALYIELQQHEKVGDLYCAINQRQKGMIHYQQVVTDYAQRHQYVKASLLCRNKMGDATAAQAMLLNGWRDRHDSVNCLTNYFASIADEPQWRAAIESVYAHDVSLENREAFLTVMRHEFSKQTEFSTRIRDIAYELIAAELPHKPGILVQLKAFNPTDKLVVKDVIRYKSKA